MPQNDVVDIDPLQIVEVRPTGIVDSVVANPSLAIVPVLACVSIYVAVRRGGLENWCYCIGFSMLAFVVWSDIFMREDGTGLYGHVAANAAPIGWIVVLVGTIVRLQVPLGGVKELERPNG